MHNGIKICQFVGSGNFLLLPKIPKRLAAANLEKAYIWELALPFSPLNLHKMVMIQNPKCIFCRRHQDNIPCCETDKYICSPTWAKCGWKGWGPWGSKFKYWLLIWKVLMLCSHIYSCIINVAGTLVVTTFAHLKYLCKLTKTNHILPTGVGLVVILVKQW